MENKMSSNRVCTKKYLREMSPRISLLNHKVVSRCNTHQSTEAHSEPASRYCTNTAVCNQDVISSTYISQTDIITRVADDPCQANYPSTCTGAPHKLHSSIQCSSSCKDESIHGYKMACDTNHNVIAKNQLCSKSRQCKLTNVTSTRNDIGKTVQCRIGQPLQAIQWRTILLFVVCFLCTAVYNADSSQCAVGLTTPGRTWPQGDIVLEYGQPLNILCILNKTFINIMFPGQNSSDLVFFRNNKEMEPEYITIVNETTISMFVEKPPPAEDMYYCKLKLHNDRSKEHEAVCLNKVVIGFKPEKPQNFNCISYNWENLTCSWKPVQNYVTTRFNLVFRLPGRAGGRMLYPCPKDYTLPPNTCLWDRSTNPIYRQPYENYTFILNVENVLGNDSFAYKFHHYAHVIPAKPANLSVINKTSESALLHWSVPFPMLNFPPGLHHRITYQNQWEYQKRWQVINITSDIHLHKRYFNLTGLEYANTIYDVRVFMKSTVAIGEDKWSQSSNTTFRTLPKLPGLPPKTDIGSFEIAENNANRDVYLYWQAIPQYLENGDNFKYQIDYVEENGRKVSLVPTETTRTYAKFKGISFNSYAFEIITTNIKGANKEKARIFVPSKIRIPDEPISFTKIAFDGGLYELSWKPPPSMSMEITNYTIFWCDNERDRPYQCTGYLDWVHVSKSTTLYNMTVPDPNKVYQFAISANTNRGSSGMIWASCTVIHNKVVGKMKSVWINRIGSDYIEVGWKLDCSDRIGIVEGFNIYYCPIVSPYNVNCKDPKQNTTIKADPHTIHGIVRYLKPYTTYMLAVAVLTKSGEGLHSDPLYNTTLEAAPSTAPQEVKITNVTNTTMFITWKPPDEMNGVLRYYEVHYNGSKQRVEAANNHVELKELVAHKMYSIGVSACTVSCSVQSPTIYRLTEIGIPGKINEPKVRFINSSVVSVLWSEPQNPAGHLDYYEIYSSDGEIQNSTTTEAQLPIPDCKTVGKEKLYQFRIRAINIASDHSHLKGEWSNSGTGSCYSDGPSFRVWIVIWVIGSLSGVACLLCLAYTSKRMWLKCKAMQDVEVKLPPGLTPNMKLLQKSGEQHMRQPSADSSGCSSGQESVTSSLTSDSHVSNDSGTETDPGPVSPNKLLDAIPAWEPSSLRQRITRPGLATDSARWDPYVKVAKSGEPVIGDALSLARSTPNLTDSTGYTTSQHTWSSTGYISMPSSEELCSNPSPVPKDSAHTGGYSVISAVPKPVRSKSEENDQLTESIGDALIPIKTEVKPMNPYITLASLEQKPKDKKTVDTLRDLDELTFTEVNKPILETLTLFSVSDKASKPYVQTGLIDTLKKPFALHSTDSIRGSISSPFASTSLTDSCNKPFVSSFASPTSFAQSLSENSSKPYVTVSAIADITKMQNVPSTLEHSQKSCIPHGSTVDTASKPYVPATSVFQMLQQQKGKVVEGPATDIEDNDNENDLPAAYSLCWQTDSTKQNTQIKTEKPMTSPKQSAGYVTITENPKLDQIQSAVSSYIQHEQFEKPLPQNTGCQSDEQYSKVTVVPSTMQ